MHIERPILTNPCDKSFEDFKKINDNLYHSSSCNKTVVDISVLKNLDYDDYKGKCIIASNDQLRDMRFLHPLKRFLVAAFLVFGSSLFLIPESYGQTNDSEKKESQFVEGAFTGRIVGNKGYEVSYATVTLVMKDGSEIKTSTNYNGEFLIEVPDGIRGSLLKLIIEYNDGDNVINKSIAINGDLARINDLGDIKIDVKQKKSKRRHRGYTAGFY